MYTTELSVGDYAKVTYTDEHGNEQTEKGHVSEVDDDPTGTHVEHAIILDEGPDTNTEVQVFHGTDEDGEAFSSVHRYDPFSGDYHLGNDASVDELE